MNYPILVYVDHSTGRVARWTAMRPHTCPAELDDFYWIVVQKNSFPEIPTVDRGIHLIQHSLMGGFSVESGQIPDADISRIEGLNVKADCLEQLSRSVSYMRYLKNRNLFSNPELMPLYFKEIEQYKETTLVGPLLGSLVDDDADVPMAIEEFKVKYLTYQDFLIQSEAVYNKWSRKIKQSSDPVAVLVKMKSSIGPFIR
jgi:hypothetical protein